jgi:hypothetical protein
LIDITGVPSGNQTWFAGKPLIEFGIPLEPLTKKKAIAMFDDQRRLIDIP